jgi:hypothetical protein
MHRKYVARTLTCDKKGAFLIYNSARMRYPIVERRAILCQLSSPHTDDCTHLRTAERQTEADCSGVVVIRVRTLSTCLPGISEIGHRWLSLRLFFTTPEPHDVPLNCVRVAHLSNYRTLTCTTAKRSND